MKKFTFIEAKNSDFQEILATMALLKKLIAAYIVKYKPATLPKTKTNMGEGAGWKYVCDVFNDYDEDPTLVPEDELSYTDFKNQGAFYENTNMLVADFKTLIKKVTSDRILSGQLLMSFSSVVLNTLERKMVKNPDLYEKRYNALNKFWTDRADKAKLTKEIHRDTKEKDGVIEVLRTQLDKKDPNAPI